MSNCITYCLEVEEKEEEVEEEEEEEEENEENSSYSRMLSKLYFLNIQVVEW